MIVATAGHVDHGKTELIKALTGINTDRLPEEKARGLTVDLGFAYNTLPDGEILGFVDVPGHEKFIRNMVAGLAGIDLGLLVIAADDGVMPQTREHLAILGLLGIKNILVALTKIDRVASNDLSEVYIQVTNFLEKEGYQEHALYPVCAPKSIGMEALREALNLRAKTIKPAVASGHFRMTIDRAFTLKGVGLVVTGMVVSGTVYNAESLTLLSDGSTLRVREIRVHNQIRAKAKAGERCALNIVGRGVSEKSIRRGTWLTHSDLCAPTRRIDVNLHVLKTETSSLKHWSPTHLHIGSDHLPARVAVLSGGNILPGASGLAQLVLPRDTFALSGDRFVLRDQSAQRTIAGGYVIDPFSPKRGRARPSRIAILKAMRGETTADVLQALATQSETGVPLKPFSISHNLLAEQIDALIVSLGLRRVGEPPNERIFCEARWRGLMNLILTSLASFHKSSPKFFGASIKDLQALLDIFFDEGTLNLALTIMISEKRLCARRNRFHLPSHNIYISEQEKFILAQATLVLAPDCGAPPGLYQAAQKIGIEASILEKTLKIGVKLGDIVLVKKNRYVPSILVAKLKASAQKLAAKSTDGLFTTIDFRDEVNMGRNFVIAVLEYFDQVGFTTRVGEFRRVQRPISNIL
jgi:selenocysteine-specific elongation factor